MVQALDVATKIRRDTRLNLRADETPPAPLAPQKTEVAMAEKAPVLPTTPYESDDPDLRMAKPSPLRDDREKITDDTAVEKVEQQSVAPAMAVPETTAPQIGMSDSDKKIVARWQRQVVVHLNQFKRYPPDARPISDAPWRSPWRLCVQGTWAPKTACTTSGTRPATSARHLAAKSSEADPRRRGGD
ncbi:MAG: hypothetical protein ABL908_06670 [Hyphomicrobium sp.]